MGNEMKNAPATVLLSGRIDSANAAETEQKITAELPSDPTVPIVLDAEKLEYVSSAGLRVILRLKKTHPDLSVVNVSTEVYDVLEMTGFTEMMDVKKAYRVVSVEGCEVIGEGANGKVYRIDGDNVVKTYKNADALSEIQHEREVARLALILGVPTAISYDIVKVGDSYGSVFELLDAKSFSKILANEPDRFDWCVSEYVRMLKTIHAVTVPEGKLPSIKRKIVAAVGRIVGILPDGLGEKLLKMTEEIPECDRMIHGDYHTKNIVLAGDEVLVIDMDTLSVGHPIFDLEQMYSAYSGFSESDPEIIRRFQGYDADTAHRFWHASLAAYLGTTDENRIREVENKVRCLSYAHLIDRSIRHNLTGNPEFALWKSRLTELLRKVDSLVFDVAEGKKSDPDALDVEAVSSNLPSVVGFVNSRLDAFDCSPKAQMQIELAVEEIFVNIANYAYAPDVGRATVRVGVTDDPLTVSITFIDRGVPYDPLKKSDPDVTLAAGDREIGGLGIFMTKKVMDDVTYEYKDGQNILTLKKRL